MVLRSKVHISAGRILLVKACEISSYDDGIDRKNAKIRSVYFDAFVSFMSGVFLDNFREKVKINLSSGLMEC